MEIWKAVPGFEGAYEVSDLGRVRSLDRTVLDAIGRATARRGRMLSPTINEGGYPSVHLSLEGHAVRIPNHVVMLRSFRGSSGGLVGRHLDGDRLNCALVNLVWGTPAENGADMVKHGTGVHSEAHYRAVLNRVQVAEIRAARGKVFQKSLAGRYGVTASTIGRVQRGETWAHV